MKKCRASAWQGSSALHIDLHGLHWQLSRGRSLEELWEEMDISEDLDDSIPYWTELWPASLLLAEFLFTRRREFSGEICIDLGCGLGFTSLMGQVLGGKVIGADYNREALGLAKSHARANLAPQPCWLCADWRSPPLKPNSAIRIWGADIIYEKRFTRPLLDFWQYCLNPLGKVWIAEPGRTIFRQFYEAACEAGWKICPVLDSDVKPLYPQAGEAHVTIWEFSRNAKKGLPL